MVPVRFLAVRNMRNPPLAPIVVATSALGACALESEILNSERIGERFGSYGIEILEHDATVRRSSLFSIEDGARICRTYAVVQFVAHESPEIAAAHQRIIAGESIGATLKSGGWELRKETLHIGSLPLSDNGHRIAALMRLDAPGSLGLHAYRLILDKDSRSLHYATIVETHHPDYLTSDENSH